MVNSSLQRPKNPIMSVSQLNLLLRECLENDPLLLNIGVTGEISNWRAVPSIGQIYFTISDGQSSLSCMLFQATLSRLAFVPRDKQQVHLKGKIRFFQKRGSVHFQVNYMAPAGVGMQHVQLEALKAKLKEEGLFEVSRKRQLPVLPDHVAVITAPESAAFADFVRIFSEGFGWAKVSLIPSLMQGASAPAQIVDAFDAAEQTGASVIVLLRGGGSQEDLSCFNDEAVVRRVAAADQPVITAIGHETDVPLVDFVADVRASTPTAAAQIVVTRLVQTVGTVFQAIEDAGDAVYSRIERLQMRVIRHAERAENVVTHRLEVVSQKAQMLLSAIQLSDPIARLRHGYSVVNKAEGGVVRSVSEVAVGESLTIVVSDGVVSARVEATTCRDLEAQ